MGEYWNRSVAIVRSIPGWSVTGDSSANVAKTITKAAVAGERHYITGFDVSISGADAGADITISLKDGSTDKWKVVIGSGSARGATRSCRFDGAPIMMTVNTAANLVVTAGGALVITHLNLNGYTQI